MLNRSDPIRVLRVRPRVLEDLEPLVTGPPGRMEASPRGPSGDAEQSSASKSLIASAMYSGCSVGMLLVNKNLASSYNGLKDLYILLVVFQAIAAMVCVEFSKHMGWVDYPAFHLSTARSWAPVNVLFCGMLFTGMASLEHNSVPMVTVFKNITNIMTTLGDCILYGARVDFPVLAAFGIMLAGAVMMAASNSAGVTQTGLFWMVANCLCTSGYVLYLKFATRSVRLSKFGMVFYNNVLCVLFLFPVTLVNGQLGKFLGKKALHTADYAVKNALAGFVGFFLNFASLKCIAQAGPTTYAMLGSLNKVPIAIFRYLIFDNVISGETWFILMGGILYTIAKFLHYIETGRIP
ncbi:hypothetical protein THAOC_20121 [Thalassiosira oceanica]|uniref:Sugar phosphate transporter domain-containing protein n=1 Tax=Thalassiosira oceanica TaxID=159749 RepID=K0S0P0_THAOC|nr:hypothetical protein THAOC_20121 [Thalassiosira oceanica]|eukprot:EJK59623.1 hypothetical protein THAOC_20121 [Thalassiosira oceanica]